MPKQKVNSKDLHVTEFFHQQTVANPTDVTILKLEKLFIMTPNHLPWLSTLPIVCMPEPGSQSNSTPSLQPRWHVDPVYYQLAGLDNSAPTSVLVMVDRYLV